MNVREIITTPNRDGNINKYQQYFNLTLAMPAFNGLKFVWTPENTEVEVWFLCQPLLQFPHNWQEEIDAALVFGKKK